MFRVTGVPTDQLGSDKPPILIWHGLNGSGGDMAGWAAPFSQKGYDVWFGTSRGAWYSNKHVKDAEGSWSSLKERWDFSWAEFGVYDVPAVIELIRSVTGKPKVTYMGYSQGATQMYYGLAKKQDYYAERINRFIALTTCIYVAPLFDDYEEAVKTYLTYDRLGIYNKFGGDESSATVEKVCGVLGASECEDYGDPEEHGASIQQYMHYAQCAIEGRF